MAHISKPMDLCLPQTCQLEAWADLKLILSSVCTERMSPCLLACMYDSLSVQNVCLCACQHACMIVCLYRMYVSVSVGMHVCQSVCLCACQHACVPVCLYRTYVSVSVSIHVCQPVMWYSWPKP